MSELTPRCKESDRLYWQWAACAPEMKLTKAGWLQEIKKHHEICPQCRARMAQMNELARNAEHPAFVNGSVSPDTEE